MLRILPTIGIIGFLPGQTEFITLPYAKSTTPTTASQQERNISHSLTELSTISSSIVVTTTRGERHTQHQLPPFVNKTHQVFSAFFLACSAAICVLGVVLKELSLVLAFWYIFRGLFLCLCLYICSFNA